MCASTLPIIFGCTGGVARFFLCKNALVSSAAKKPFYYFLREIRKAALESSKGKEGEKQALVRIELPGDASPVVGSVEEATLQH